MSGVANSIVMDNTILVKTSSLKYLGVIVDHKLNWIEHISYVRNKVSKGIGIMYKARRFLTPERPGIEIPIKNIFGDLFVTIYI